MRPEPRGLSTEGSDDAEPITWGLRVTVIGGPARGSQASIGPGGVRIGSDADNDIVIVGDRRVSRRHLSIKPHPGGVLVEDLGSRNGTMLGAARIERAVLPPGSVLGVGDSELLVEPDRATVDIPPAARSSLAGLIGHSNAMRRLFTVIERVAPTDYTVLIEGETGTGKELVARALHELSPRRGGPLVTFDCASTTETLMESELFGHVRGAFTGAVAPRQGAFRRADKGTLFIDELTSLAPPLQSKLLRVLEAREVRPVGSDEEVPVDVRIVAATNRPLRELVKSGGFREDLYFRMSVVHLAIPPLRARLEDVPPLLAHFLRLCGFEGEASGPALDRLLGHGWPGNVRELRNTVERAVALAGSPKVPFEELPLLFGEDGATLSWPLPLDLPFKDAKERLTSAFERVYATQLLARSGQNISEAARRAGLSRRHFFELLKKHDLLPRGADED